MTGLRESHIFLVRLNFRTYCKPVFLYPSGYDRIDIRTNSALVELTDKIRRRMPPLPDDIATPEAHERRVDSAIAHVASLRPETIAELQQAIDAALATIHADDCLRQTCIPGADPKLVDRCYRQYMSMTRTAQSATRLLVSMIEKRRKYDMNGRQAVEGYGMEKAIGGRLDDVNHALKGASVPEVQADVVREVEEEYAIPPDGQEAPVWSAEVTRLPLSRPYSPRAPKLRTDADERRGRRYEEPKYALSRR